MKTILFPSKSLAKLTGMAGGALLAALLMQPLRLMPESWYVWGAAALMYALLMAAGWRIGKQYSNALSPADVVPINPNIPKVLDTSVLIDGRILDIAKAGFLEGELIIPAFVLAELRHIADSSDALRRNRGRRGLDIIAHIQEDLSGCTVRVEEQDYPDLQEVDVKLLRLSRDVGGVVMTNDYNLNKVAAVTGVRVMNINELANAVKPVVLPGEEMTVQVVREGKEPGQGVAYLDDGTMVVVESARRHVGEVLDVVVTTVLQTSAGRMIFGRVKTAENRAV